MRAHTVCLVLILGVMWSEVWSASPVPSVPDHVQALVGHCVVIPCSFAVTPQHPKARRERVDVRLRYRGGGPFFPLRSTAFNSQDEQVSRDFLGRTSLFGETGKGDCSVLIERVRRDDPQVFEVSLKRADETFWGRQMNVHLDIFETLAPPAISGMLSATDGEVVTLNCSIRYPCPSRPPVLQWKWDRGAQNNSEQGEVHAVYSSPHRPMLMASLSFTASHQAKPRLVCEATYPGAVKSATSRDLHVTFPPKEVKVQVQTLVVHDGGSALLMCSCKADPPVSEYRWSYSQHGQTVHLRHRSHSVRLYNVSRDLRVTCSAHNAIGRGESQPTSLNIQYKPVIHRPSSNCSVTDSKLLCRCSVDSNPKPAVTWSVNGSLPPHSYNVSATSQFNVWIASLRGRMDKHLQVICFAFNSLGNDSLVVQEEEPAGAPLLWLVLAAAVVTCLLVFISSIVIYVCRRKLEKCAQHSTFDPDDLGIYHERIPLYINCTEVTHVYTNGSYQLVYQNSTPVFVHSTQMRPMARRGGERRRGGDVSHLERRAGAGVRDTTRAAQGHSAADPDTAIYVEIL